MRELRGNFGPVHVEMLQRRTLGTGHGLARERGRRDPGLGIHNQRGRKVGQRPAVQICLLFLLCLGDERVVAPH